MQCEADMENFLISQRSAMERTTTLLRKDLVKLRLVEKNEPYTKAWLKHRIRGHLDNIDTIQFMINWATDRPDEVSNFMLNEY